ncbi:XRE family transcriptional regulator [Weissella viridescens]|uniref:XRE family transcriptional regulator n=1 Tax=Weissella viridescens TaxID=1629 RepID=A0A3P2RMM2_WEIVI|nr:helix-turn-helix transcriptional regulator [Weissella viridescens]RRG18768.1 XRE family transcriptional regulator [Weissella viridescens]
MEFSKLLKTERMQQSLTQTELADQVFVSSKTISNWETGKTLPDLDSVVRLAQVLDLSLDTLLLEDKQMQENIKAQESIRETKRFLLFASITNFFFIIILFIQPFVGQLPSIVGWLITLATFSNLFVIAQLGRHLGNLKQEIGQPYSAKRARVIFILEFLAILLIIFALNFLIK